MVESSIFIFIWFLFGLIFKYMKWLDGFIISSIFFIAPILAMPISSNNEIIVMKEDMLLFGVLILIVLGYKLFLGDDAKEKFLKF